MAGALAERTTALPPPEPDNAKPRRRLAPYLLLLPGMLWLLVFFVLPIITLASTSTQTKVAHAEVGTYAQTWRFANYVDVIKQYHEQLIRSFEYAAFATIACLLIGYPLAFVIAFRAGRFRNLLLVLVIAPFFTSFILRTIAWKQILGSESRVSGVLRDLHLLGQQSTLTGTSLAVVAGITYNFLPFMVLPLYASLERIDPRLVEAAGDLYAGPSTGLRKVVFPLSMPGVVAGTLLTFIPAAGDYVNAALLGSPRTQMIGNVVDSRFFRVKDYPAASSLSFVLMACILVLVTIYVRRAGTEELV